jgi:aspartyl-tRNA(Asn)/glutamyl-tRNA(Gln) amidotransferase subunit C
LTSADVARLAELARIELSAAELDRLTGQLDAILESVAVVQAAVAEVAADPSPPALVNVLRADRVTVSLPAAAVLAAAPDQEDGRFKVPHILEDD